MNTDKICRCCMALDVPLLSIYDGGSVGMGCVADMLQQIAKLMPQPDDKMPQKACLQCISEINRCFVFKMKCENSNRTLRQLLPEAVPEPLDFKQKNVLVTSSAVQTDDKILISSLVQTEEEEKPLVSHSSVQIIEEVRTFVSHKKMQTEYEVIQPGGNKLKSRNDDLEDIFIYEIENSSEKNGKREQSLCEDNHVKKRLCIESSKANDCGKVEESQESAQESNAYILLEDSNCSEQADICTPSSTENRKSSECDRYEYYENEVVEFEDDEEKNLIYQDNDDSNENVNMSTVYEIESSEGKNKSDEEAEAIIKPGNNIKKLKRQYKCSQCIMTFVSMKVLKRHLANRHDIKGAEIIIDYLPTDDPDVASNDVDGSSYNTIVELTPKNVAKPQLMPREKTTTLANEEILTNIKYFCDNCQAGFVQRKTLTKHIKHRVCMTNNFKCNICESIFVSEENLETHNLTHENPHKCLECDTACKTIEELSEHMISNHNRSARNQCHVCKKVFTMKTSLNDHLRIHSGEKPFLCTICGKSFRQNSNLRQHLTRHTNEKNFKCDICNNAYVTKAELFSHKRTHTGDHPFKCDICQARYTTSCSLKKHVRKHTGERPYACEFCPMRFAALNVLKNHRRIHTGEKPFKCVHCSKTFTQKGDCLMHERTHTNNDFKCFCESKFSRKSNLVYHIKTQHPDYTEKEVQAMLDKSIVDQDDDDDYQITLMENTGEKLVSSTNDENDNDVFVENSQGKASANNSDEFVEVLLEDVG